jgi:signal transduction histidine kinase
MRDQSGPLSSAPSQPLHTKVRGVSEPHGDSKNGDGNVLVVEDNPDMSSFIAESLADDGFSVAVAFDGKQGYRMAMEGRPDLVLTDIMMPVMSGDELLRALRSNAELETTPIIVLTARADEELRVRLLREGAQDYLTKPFLVEELRTRVRNLIGRQRAERELERLREEWASIVAHDLQQPINSIVLRTDLLLRGAVTGEQRRDMEQIRASAMRLSRMARDLMDASRLESRHMSLTLERLDIGELVRDVVERHPGAAARASVRTPTDRRLFVRGDAERLEQVLANILSNAMKYGDVDTGIQIDVEEVKGQAEVSVANRGAGIPREELEFLFERYTRTRRARTSGTKGAGLGLYIAKGLVEAHGGRIWAESVPDKVTRFTFSVALDGPPAQVRARHAP